MNKERRSLWRVVLCLCLSLAALSPLFSADEPSPLQTAVQEVRPAVVYIEQSITAGFRFEGPLDDLSKCKVVDYYGNSRLYTMQGSGTIVTPDGLILTNEHTVRFDAEAVVQAFGLMAEWWEPGLKGGVGIDGLPLYQGDVGPDGLPIIVYPGRDQWVTVHPSLEVTVDRDGPRERTLPAKIVYVDDEYDFALLRPEKRIEEAMPFARVGDCKHIPHGLPVASLGYPARTPRERTLGEGRSLHVSVGSVSAAGSTWKLSKDKLNVREFLFSTMGPDIVAAEATKVQGKEVPPDREGVTGLFLLISLEHGQSGGPVIDPEGRVIGVVQARAEDEGQAVRNFVRVIEQWYAEEFNSAVPNTDHVGHAVAVDVIKERLAKYAPGIAAKLLLAAASYKAVEPDSSDVSTVREALTEALQPPKAAGTGRVYAVTFSPDEHLLASAFRDDTVKLWDIDSGQCRQTLQGHSPGVLSVPFSPDGELLASGSWGEFIKLWDVGSGQCRQTLQGHTDWVNSVAFSPDGELLASGSRDETTKLWDVATGQSRQTLQAHTDFVESVAFSPDGQLLASGSDDKTTKLWDVGSRQCRQTLRGHNRGVSSVAFSPDGQLLASGSWDNTIKLWDVGTGQCRQTLQGHSNSVVSVALSPDGQVLASGSWDGTIKLWDVATGQCRQTLQ